MRVYFTPSKLIKLLREEEFVFIGLCEDGSVRVGCRGRDARARQYSKDHAKHAAVLALADIIDPEEFESAVMAYL